MTFEVEYCEDVHLPQLEDCPDPVQGKFGEAIEQIKTCSRQEILNIRPDFLSKVDGFPRYEIEAYHNSNRYVMVLEWSQKERNKLKLLTIGRAANVRLADER